jgi:type VI secretion system Hcp family effector
MAATIHMKITKVSDPSKPVAGYTSQKGDDFFAGMIECTYFEQSVSTPFESGNSVQATSNRSHSPALVRKHVDEATPAIRELMRLTEPLNVEFFFHRPAEKKSGDHRFFGIQLTNAKIASIKMVSPDAMLDGDNDTVMPHEEIHFLFETIKTSYYNEADSSAIESHDSHQKSWSAGK